MFSYQEKILEFQTEDQKFPKIMKSIYEKMMLASKSLRKNPQMENLLLEAFVWPKAE